MNQDELANLKAKHASDIRDLEHRLKNEIFADALDLEMKVRTLETENQALAREVETLRAEGHRLTRVINMQKAHLDGPLLNGETDPTNPAGSSEFEKSLAV